MHVTFNLQDFTISNSLKLNAVNSTDISSESLITEDLTAENVTEVEPFNVSDNSPGVNLTAVDSVQKYGLGTRYSYNGNVYRYCWIPQNPSTEGLAFQSLNLMGSVTVSATTSPTLLITSLVQGTFTCTVTATATVVANQYKNYSLYVTDGDYGQNNWVVSHPAATVGQPLVLTVLLPLQGVTTGISLRLVPSRWMISTYAGIATQVPMGVLLTDLGAGQTGYVWIQTYGYTGIKTATDTGVPSNVPAPGKAVIPAPGNSGRIMSPRTDTAADGNIPIIGTCLIAATAVDKIAYVYLYICN